MKGRHLRKVEARAATWAEQYAEGALIETDDLIRVVAEDVPALVGEVRKCRGQIEELRVQTRECRAREARVRQVLEVWESMLPDTESSDPVAVTLAECLIDLGNALAGPDAEEE
jgi:hypothetical protein